MAVSPFEIDVDDTASSCIDVVKHGAAILPAKEQRATRYRSEAGKLQEVAVNLFHLLAGRVRMPVIASASGRAGAMDFSVDAPDRRHEGV